MSDYVDHGPKTHQVWEFDAPDHMTSGQARITLEEFFSMRDSKQYSNVMFITMLYGPEDSALYSQKEAEFGVTPKASKLTLNLS